MKARIREEKKIEEKEGKASKGQGGQEDEAAKRKMRESCKHGFNPFSETACGETQGARSSQNAATLQPQAGALWSSGRFCCQKSGHS